MGIDKKGELERALSSPEPSADKEVDALVDVADRVRDALALEPGDAARPRALFVAGVAARSRRSIGAGIVLAVVAAASSFALIAMSASRALPGDDLYALRRVLAAAGIMASPVEDMDRRIAAARNALIAAKRRAARAPDAAAGAALDALVDVAAARRIAARLGAGQRLARIRQLEGELRLLIANLSAPDRGQRDRRRDGDADTDRGWKGLATRARAVNPFLLARPDGGRPMWPGEGGGGHQALVRWRRRL
jgi:hypothetical protein